MSKTFQLDNISNHLSKKENKKGKKLGVHRNVTQIGWYGMKGG
jgi:hypothetical protein